MIVIHLNQAYLDMLTVGMRTLPVDLAGVYTGNSVETQIVVTAPPRRKQATARHRFFADDCTYGLCYFNSKRAQGMASVAALTSQTPDQLRTYFIQRLK